MNPENNFIIHIFPATSSLLQYALETNSHIANCNKKTRKTKSK